MMRSHSSALVVLRAFLVVLSAALLSACAAAAEPDRYVNLVPPAQVPVSLAAKARPAVTLARARDLRADKESIGTLRDANDVIVARVRPANEVAPWVADSLAASLQAAGYRVERAESVETARTPLVVAISVTDVSADFKPVLVFIGKARVAVRVEVYKQAERILDRTYSGSYQSTDAGIMYAPSAFDYQQLLNRAMVDFLQKAVPDLNHAISQAA